MPRDTLGSPGPLLTIPHNWTPCIPLKTIPSPANLPQECPSTFILPRGLQQEATSKQTDHTSDRWSQHQDHKDKHSGAEHREKRSVRHAPETSRELMQQKLNGWLFACDNPYEIPQGEFEDIPAERVCVAERRRQDLKHQLLLEIPQTNSETQIQDQFAPSAFTDVFQPQT
ncbi:hypothetical protein DNTS_003643 [Danionella cerebrum]|uniref:Uncharacterized protein n=1 Tax=Danionella cerebrum TaxID=2873325 RepID=A0A553NRK0_9TELE|nr:hypothetical protein DNTS_003643 [Danionella translucida]